MSIIEELNKGECNPIYLLYGEEEFLIEKTIEKMKSTMLHPEWIDFNITTVDLLKQPVEVAIEEAERFPFGEGRRLVLAKNALFLTGSTLRGSVDHSLEKLSEYLDHPTDFSSLVLIVPYNKLDERKKIVKELLKKSKVMHAVLLSPEEWLQWVKNRIKEKGIRLDEQGLEILIRYLPNNLRIVEQEMEKISIYGKENLISNEELVHVITRTVEGDVFTLVEKIINRDFHGGFEIYEELMKQNEEPIKILALFARQFRIILQSKVLSGQGFTQKQIATQLKLHPYPIKLATAQGGHYTENELLRIISILADIDFQIKTGQIDKRLALELVLMEIQPKEQNQPMKKTTF